MHKNASFQDKKFWHNPLPDFTPVGKETSPPHTPPIDPRAFAYRHFFLQFNLSLLA